MVILVIVVMIAYSTSMLIMKTSVTIMMKEMGIDQRMLMLMTMPRASEKRARQQFGRATWNITRLASKLREAGSTGRGLSRGGSRWASSS